jgi:hypothetical protein
MSERLFEISTIVTKVPNQPSVLNFEVNCREHDPEGDPHAGRTEPIGWLTGFVADRGYLPESELDRYFDVFDMRSAHASEAFRILIEQRPKIMRALPHSDLAHIGSGVAMLERVWIAPELRGRRLALRLMREAGHLLGRHGLLVMLKAHPDGDDVSSDALISLAKYYQSDEWLSLKELSRRSLPGWLVSHWDGPDAAPGEELFWGDHLGD